MNDITERTTFHKEYTSLLEKQITRYEGGLIESITFTPGEYDPVYDETAGVLTVLYRTGQKKILKSTCFTPYNALQFGITVSANGKYLFAQSYEEGLYCFDIFAGILKWKSVKKIPITTLFASDKTIIAMHSGKSLQMIDMETGKILREKKHINAWGFYSLDNRYLLCRINEKKWDIIDTETLKTVETFTNAFTNQADYYALHRVELQKDGTVFVSGTRIGLDRSGNPPKILKDIPFKKTVKSEFFSRKMQNPADRS